MYLDQLKWFGTRKFLEFTELQARLFCVPNTTSVQFLIIMHDEIICSSLLRANLNFKKSLVNKCFTFSLQPLKDLN